MYCRGVKTMSEEFTVYDTRTGAISHRALPARAIPPGNQGMGNNRYPAHGCMTTSGTTAAASSRVNRWRSRSAATTITGIPDGATLHCDGRDYGPIDDGIAEFEFNLPGEYRADIRCVSHINGSVTLVQP